VPTILRGYGALCTHAYVHALKARAAIDVARSLKGGRSAESSNRRDVPAPNLPAGRTRESVSRKSVVNCDTGREGERKNATRTNMRPAPCARSAKFSAALPREREPPEVLGFGAYRLLRAVRAPFFFFFLDKPREWPGDSNPNPSALP
jgi:hypothetical protein